ncbi:MAG: efflux RND transporter periplasmic adaptor subunit [Rhodobacteraceae bacterium]|nr:efflux RND transporter periplasmic adaptor subunit [Paracoccaceae bacterium]
MRLISILTAILVTVALYFLVMQRDRLLAFAGVEPAAETTEADESGDDQTLQLTRSDKIGVVVLRSEAQVIDSAVVLRGETRALRQVEVRSETSANVISEPLRKGALVQKGDLLCRLDSGTRDADLAQARAALSEAQARVPESQARLEEAQAKLQEALLNNNAAERLIEGGYASETRLATTRAEVSAAQASIKAAESGLESTAAGIEAAAARVAQAKKEIDRLTIEAPFSGLLESDAAELGSLMQPGSLCATVIQLNQVKLVGYVPETEINRVAIGATAAARLTTGQEIVGTVNFVSRSADPTTRTFEVEILVDNADLAIRDGQTAEIAIASPGARAHKLPQSALTLNNDGQLGVRTVDASSIVQFMPVEVLNDSSSGIWLGGLPETVDVIVVGQDFVMQGVEVAPTYQEVTQ